MFAYKYSLDELKNLAEEMAVSVEQPFSLLLHGEVGTGKTAFAKFFIEKILLSDELVTSPTFNIIQNYQTSKGVVWHADLYRIKSEAEILSLGLLEAMNENICLIEWPTLLRKYVNHFKFGEIFFDCN